MHNYNSDKARSYSLQEAAYGVSKWQRNCQHFKFATKVKQPLVFLFISIARVWRGMDGVEESADGQDYSSLLLLNLWGV